MDINELIDGLTAQADTDYIGESVSQLAHALQAAYLAGRADVDEKLILAALLHDLGHWCETDDGEVPGEMAGLGRLRHEHIGAEAIRRLGLAPDIAELVAMHVDAKRYLVATRDGYALSEASRETLAHQGGPMTPAEVARFEAAPLMADALKLRAWDEAAKDPDLDVPGPSAYRAMLRRNRVQPLDNELLQHWRAAGFVHVKGWFSEAEMDRIEAATAEIEAWPETAGKWMKYFESPPGEDRLLCRVENFLQYQPVFNAVARSSATLNLLSLLMDEPAVLFKEKINFKYPGGQGFAPHQDAPAFTSFDQHFHITMMLSIDATTLANGCLEVADVERLAENLPVNPDLTIRDETAANLHWKPVETEPGDLVLFDSYLPHRSGTNSSQVPRRALYATYNRARDGGDVRDRYFAEKRRTFPPDVERVAGRTYEGGIFNVGNPVATASVAGD